MGLVRKHTLYRLGTMAWWLVVAGSTIAVGTGNAEPYVSPAVVPDGPVGLFGSIVALGVIGTVALTALETRSWKRTGRRAGLSPEGVGLRGKPDLTGTVDGRAVTASTYEGEHNSGGEGGTQSVTYTLVEADLDDPTDDGYVVGTGDVSAYDDDIPSEIQTQAVDGEHFVLGDVSEADARSVLTPQLEDALDGPVNAVVVGNPTDAITSAIPDDVDGYLGSMLVSGMESALRDKETFAAGAASHDEKGLLLNATELEARVEAVAAAADAQAAARADATRTEPSPD